MDSAAEEHDLEVVYECTDDGEAEIIIEYLQSNGIEAMENSNLPHSMLPVAGDAQVVVNEADAEEARRLLKEREAQQTNDAGEADETEEE